MAKSLSYKETTTVNLKVAGLLNLKNNTVKIEIDDDLVEKRLHDLLKDFDGQEIELSVKVKNEQELELPEVAPEDDE